MDKIIVDLEKRLSDKHIHISLSNKDSSPVLVVFKEGKQIAKTGALYDEDTFASKEGLKAYLEKYVV